VHDVTCPPRRHLVSGADPRSAGVVVEQGGALMDRVHAVLGRGPVPTMMLAAEVLGIAGNPAAAARAVWTLLGQDPRFEVDADGVWSLRAAPARPLRPLWEEEWVVVDVETTGGSPGAGHRVTEVAAVRVAGGEIRDSYATLVNPQRPIPRMISALTGISDEMVSAAPRFAEIAPRLADVLSGHIFVAHNASFDWRFVTAEMERSSGRTLSGRQLCTVRLSRKLLPHLPSRSLDALAMYFNLKIASRHRALDDAVATAHLLLRLLEMLRERGIEEWAEVDALLGRRSPRRKRVATPRSMDSA
jgi:DNA polymerase III epsilon subunit family exonuclease